MNAGSILETDDQLGLAHFVEHTAFNGTTHFAKNDLVKYLQSIGVRFGADLNAYTGFDETVYILPIPTDTARIVDQAFTILEDWAHGQVFDSTEVTNERGVVREEWRLGKGASDRMLHQWLPIALKGSLYAERLPIGNEQSIMTATPARLRSFYKNWYRPDLQAVIAVGDFDPAAIEAQIKKHFGGIPKPVNPPKRTLATVPANKEPLIAIASDKEATGSDVELMFKLPVEKTKTVADYRRDLTERLYLGMLNTRLDEISQKPDAPFLGAGGVEGQLHWPHDRRVHARRGVKDGGIERGLEALLVEAKRVDQFGFLQSELDREKESLVRGYERAYAERDKTQSSALVQEYINNYLTRRSDSRNRVRVQARAAARADDHARRRQQAGEQLDHRRQSRDHRRVAGEGRREDSDARRAARRVPARGQGAGDGVHGESVDGRAARRTCRPAGKVVSTSIDSGGQRHGVEAVERRARAREADRLQGRRSVVRRVQPGRNVAGVGRGLHVGEPRVADRRRSAASASSTRSICRRS